MSKAASATAQKTSSKLKADDTPEKSLRASFSVKPQDDDKNAFSGWPEWSEADLASEKWTMKGAFEDTEFQLSMLPKSISQLYENYKRLNELEPNPVITSGVSKEVLLSNQPVNNQPVMSRVSENARRKSHNANSILGLNESTTEADSPLEEELFLGSSKEKLSNFTKINLHLMEDPFMRQIVIALHILLEQTGSDSHCWDCIYPKGKDGLPMFNPTGKYFVKLFWMGAWRKVVIDDRIPVNSQGVPLLVASPQPNEMWTLLLSKALVKLASTCAFRDELMREDYDLDFDCFYCLKGWLPEKIPIQQLKSHLLLNRHFKTVSEAQQLLESEKKEEEKKPLNEPAPKVKSGAAPHAAAHNASANAALSLVRFPVILLHSSSWKEQGNDDKIHGTFVCKQYFLDEQTIYPCLFSRKNTQQPEIDYLLKIHDQNSFSYFTIYHDPNSAKFQKKQTVADSLAKDAIPSLLYALDDSKDLILTVAVHGCASKQDPAVPLPAFWMQEYSIDSVQAFQNPILKVPTAMIQVRSIVLTAGSKAYDFLLDSLHSSTICVNFLSDDGFLVEDYSKFLTERKACHVKDLEGALPAISAHEYTLVSRLQLKFTQDAFLSIQLHCSEQVDSVIGCFIYNNDNANLMEHDVYRPLPTVFKQNEKGYTMYIEANTKTAIPAGSFRVRLISKQPFDQILSEIPSALAKKPTSVDFEDVYITNKNMILLKYKLNVLSKDPVPVFAYLRHCSSQMHLKLQLLKNDSIQNEQIGIGGLIARNLVLTDSTYKLVGLLDEFDTFLVENAQTDHPEWAEASLQAAPVQQSGKQQQKTKANASVTETKKISNWKLRIQTFEPQNAFELVKDLDSEERLKQQKKQWEEAEPGRAQKAKEARETFLKFVDHHQLKPYYSKLNGDFIKGWTYLDQQGTVVKNSLKKGYLDKIDLRKPLVEVQMEEGKDYQLLKSSFPASNPLILSEEDLVSRRNNNANAIKQFEEYKATFVDYRKDTAERSKKMNALVNQSWEQIQAGFEKAIEEDNLVRDAYREHLIKVQQEEEMAAADESMDAKKRGRLSSKTKS